jgi:glycosyltransferase involved in cell wall biosynthesis
MKLRPQISVGLPVYNAEAYLVEAIESHLSQSYADFELVISDNASTDATRSICESYAKRDSRIKYFRQKENWGASWNHARVFSLCNREYFRWAAADDIPSAALLEETVHLLQADPRIVLCVPHTKNINDSGDIIATLPQTLDLNMDDPVARAKAVLTRGYQMVFPQGLMRRDALMATRRKWDYFGWDFILLLELALLGPFAQTETSYLLRRIHPGQASRVQRNRGFGVKSIEPTFRTRFIFPHWRWQFERLRAVLRSPINLNQKCQLTFFLGRHAWWSRHSFVRDVTVSAKAMVGQSEELSL